MLHHQKLWDSSTYFLPLAQLKLLANFVLSKPRSAVPDWGGKTLVLKDTFKENKSMVSVPRALEFLGGGLGVGGFLAGGCLQWVFYRNTLLQSYSVQIN